MHIWFLLTAIGAEVLATSSLRAATAAAAVVGWLVFSERMSFAVITGIGLVVSGVLLIELCGRGGHS